MFQAAFKHARVFYIVTAVTAATNDAVEKGCLLPEDGETIVTWAPSEWRSQTGRG